MVFDVAYVIGQIICIIAQFLNLINKTKNATIKFSFIYFVYNVWVFMWYLSGKKQALVLICFNSDDLFALFANILTLSVFCYFLLSDLQLVLDPGTLRLQFVMKRLILLKMMFSVTATGLFV